VLLLENGKKPFPMLYEELFLNAIKYDTIDEIEMKSFIGDSVSRITQNEIHALIRELPNKNIITTNYEFTLEGIMPELNNSLVTETVYSVFRQYEVNHKYYWHVHGDCKVPA